MANLQLPFGIRVLNQLPTEDKYLNDGVAYVSTSEVNTLVAIGIRHVGLTVNINNIEYWYANGITDGDLVIKSPSVVSGGGVTGATNGITKVGANVRLGGNLIAPTTIGLGSNNLTFTATTGTLRYGSNLSAQYNVRSLPDVGYVTGLTSNLLSISSFNTYSASTLTNINSRLLTSAFNTYSASTLTNINSKLASASNGLTKLGTNVVLGGSLSGTTTITLGNNDVIFANSGTGVLKYSLDGSANYDARTIVDKAYVDSIAAGLDPKQSVRVATTANLSSATYNPTGGVSGTGQLNTAPTTIDGITLATGNRILVKNQTDAKQNGIYTVVSSGTWNRATDQDGTPANEVSSGNFTFVEVGSTLASTGWVLGGDGTLTLNTDNLNWIQYSAANSYIQGNGISILGNTISVNLGTNSGLNTTSGLVIDSSIAGAGLTLTSGVLAVGASNGLSIQGKNVTLGGLLTGATTITSPATGSRLSFAAFPVQYSTNVSSNFNARSLTDVGYVTGITSGNLTISAFNTYSAETLTNINSRLLTTNFNVYSAATLTNINSRLLTSNFNVYSAATLTNINSKLASANNGLTKSGTNVRLGGNLTGATTIGLGSNDLTFTGTTATLKYGSDLSSNYTLRSIPDVNYVTGLTSTIKVNKITVRVTSISTTLTNNDYLLLVDTTSLITATLPASPVDGQIYKIKDYNGNAFTNNITVSGNGKTIDGASSAFINSDRGGLELVFSTTTNGWNITAFIS
jgi:hypothetical protein